MPVISGGNVIPAGVGVEPDTKIRIAWIENFAGGTVGSQDATVQSQLGRAPINGDLAGDPRTGNLYERQGGTNWVRIDTI